MGSTLLPACSTSVAKHGSAGNPTETVVAQGKKGADDADDGEDAYEKEEDRHGSNATVC
jgi:hypothetical protein